MGSTLIERRPHVGTKDHSPRRSYPTDRVSESNALQNDGGGTVPCPVQLSQRCVGWHLEEINAWIESRERAGSDRRRALEGNVVSTCDRTCPYRTRGGWMPPAGAQLGMSCTR